MHAVAISRFSGVALVLSAALLVMAGCGEESTAHDPDPVAQATLEEGTQAFRRFNFRRALVLADSVIQRAPNWAEGYVLRAKALGEAGLLDESEAAFGRAIDLEAEDPEIWTLRGKVALGNRHPEKAVKYFQKAAALDGTSTAWVNVGRAYAALDDVEAGRDAFEHAIALNQNAIDAYLGLARMYEQEGDLQAAITNGRRAEVRQGGNIETHELLGQLYMKIGRADLAVPHLKAIADRWPGHYAANRDIGEALKAVSLTQYAEPYLARADSLQKAGHDWEDVEEAVAAHPTDPLANSAMGHAMRRQGRYGDALRYYQIARFFDPDSLEYANNAAAMMLLRDDDQAAIDVLQRLLDRDSTYVEGWLNLGVAYVKTGQDERARRAWERVLAIDPDNELAPDYLADLNETPPLPTVSGS